MKRYIGEDEAAANFFFLPGRIDNWWLNCKTRSDFWFSSWFHRNTSLCIGFPSIFFSKVTLTHSSCYFKNFHVSQSQVRQTSVETQPLLWMLLYIALMVVPVNWAKRADSSCTVEIQILHLEGQNFSTTSISHSQILRISTSAPIFFCSSYRRDSFNSRSKDPEAIMWMCKGPSGLSSLVPRVLGRSLKAPTWFKTLVIST